jgi:hypothetical protein
MSPRAVCCLTAQALARHLEEEEAAAVVMQLVDVAQQPAHLLHEPAVVLVAQPHELRPLHRFYAQTANLPTQGGRSNYRSSFGA